MLTLNKEKAKCRTSLNFFENLTLMVIAYIISVVVKICLGKISEIPFFVNYQKMVNNMFLFNKFLICL